MKLEFLGGITLLNKLATAAPTEKRNTARTSPPSGCLVVESGSLRHTFGSRPGTAPSLLNISPATTNSDHHTRLVDAVDAFSGEMMMPASSSTLGRTR